MIKANVDKLKSFTYRNGDFIDICTEIIQNMSTPDLWGITKRRESKIKKYLKGYASSLEDGNDRIDFLNRIDKMNFLLKDFLRFLYAGLLSISATACVICIGLLITLKP